MKKKITAIFLCVALVAVAVVGASLAYFTDTDKADNVFTVGNVDIILDENFEQGSKLLPATGSAQDGTLKNGVTKEARVVNDGTEDAYVRLHIAIPQILDDGAETFDAKNNVLHFNYASDSIGEGKWDWTTTTGAPYEGKPWNYYETEINNIKYNVYVVTYEAVVPAHDGTTYYCTENAVHQFYLDSKVTTADMEKLTETLGDDWHIYVVAEGCQSEGFTDAYAALNTAFGVPGSYTVAWPVATTAE